MDLDTRLKRVEALEEIRLLKAKYCDLCDDGYPADKLVELFTSSGTWDGGEMGVYEGRDALHKFFTSMPSVMSFAIHHVMNSAIAVSDDAESACGRWYLLQTATLKHSNQAVWLAARYEDQLVRSNGRWLMDRVTLRTRFYTTHEAGWAATPHLLNMSNQ